MPKFMTYQRPIPVNQASWTRRPGVPYGKPGKQLPKPAPATKTHALEIELPLKLLPRVTR